MGVWGPFSTGGRPFERTMERASAPEQACNAPSKQEGGESAFDTQEYSDFTGISASMFRKDVSS